MSWATLYQRIEGKVTDFQFLKNSCFAITLSGKSYSEAIKHQKL
jgi:hypothetical protein